MDMTFIKYTILGFPSTCLRHVLWYEMPVYYDMIRKYMMIIDQFLLKYSFMNMYSYDINIVTCPVYVNKWNVLLRCAEKKNS